MMKKSSGLFILLLAVVLVVQPVMAKPAPPLRVLTSDSVVIHENGREVWKFRSEMPLPDNTLMTCNGTCLAQGADFQVTAQDKAVFGLSEKMVGWDLTVQDGFVGFAMGGGAGPLDLHTPHGVLQCTVSSSPEEGEEGTREAQEREECRECLEEEELIGTLEAADDMDREQIVRGYVSVTETATVLTLTEGALRVSSCSGSVLLRRGKSMTFSQTPNVARDRMTDHLCSLKFGPCSVTGVKKEFCFLNYKCTACVPCIPECICVPPWLLVGLPVAGWLISKIEDPEDVSPK